MKYRPSLAVLGAALLFSLACMGSDEEAERQAAEIAQLQSELVDRDEAIAALEAAMAECDCPEEEPAVVEAAPPPEPAPEQKPAAALGELEVKSTSAVKAMLDGKPMRYKPLKSAYVAEGVSPGTHLLEIQNAMAKVVVSQSVSVQSGKRTRYQYKAVRKELEKLGTVNID